ncbi:hypothetical protein DEU56DRAFT_899749, partial [Suillus clintonianus]|uniref:uncharacterized protein n=1 Tax=Suillus clintonianus TaxID=1904413 RepID=UPI001B88187B
MSTAGRQIHSGRSRKKILQRLYRSTEADDFSQLRQIIKELTQENPHTRHDILMKAAEIIRQLDREYRYLLTREQTVSASTSVASSASSPIMHHPVPHPTIPAESWPVNYDHQMMLMHSSPNMPSSSVAYSTVYPPADEAAYNLAYNSGYFL